MRSRLWGRSWSRMRRWGRSWLRRWLSRCWRRSWLRRRLSRRRRRSWFRRWLSRRRRRSWCRRRCRCRRRSWRRRWLSRSWRRSWLGRRRRSRRRRRSAAKATDSGSDLVLDEPALAELALAQVLVFPAPGLGAPVSSLNWRGLFRIWFCRHWRRSWLVRLERRKRRMNVFPGAEGF